MLIQKREISSNRGGLKEEEEVEGREEEFKALALS